MKKLFNLVSVTQLISGLSFATIHRVGFFGPAVNGVDLCNYYNSIVQYQWFNCKLEYHKYHSSNTGHIQADSNKYFRLYRRGFCNCAIGGSHLDRSSEQRLAYSRQLEYQQNTNIANACNNISR